MGVINLSILVKKIMGKISGEGYLKDDDYASSSKGGTIKIDSTYATDITSGGKLKAKEITAEAYAEANDAAFISKATLDNVLAGVGGGFSLTKIFDTKTVSTTAESFTFPSGKTAADYSVFVAVVNRSSTEFASAFVPVELISTVGSGYLCKFMLTPGAAGAGATITIGFSPDGTGFTPSGIQAGDYKVTVYAI